MTSHILFLRHFTTENCKCKPQREVATVKNLSFPEITKLKQVNPVSESNDFTVRCATNIMPGEEKRTVLFGKCLGKLYISN